MCPALTIVLAADHPTSAGHFPGNPIIPGAVLLDEVVNAIGIPVSEIKAAKFLHAVRPGEEIEITWQSGNNGEVKFSCALVPSGVSVLSGILQ